MNHNRLTSLALIVLAPLALPFPLAAEHARYNLIDLGTLGGPASYFTDPGIGPGSRVLNNQGMVAGKANTSTPDPYCALPTCFDAHVFRWDKGVLTDLGTLPSGHNSDIGGINARGWIAGGSENGEIDPFLGVPVSHAVLWKGNEALDLGTLGEGLDSVALQVNEGGQVIGISSINTTPDPLSFLSGSIHPFLWQNGVMQDLGTLPGDSDALAFPGCANERNNLVTGVSVGSDATTGNVFVRPFLWDKGNMIDLGTLGGTIVAVDPPSCVNNRGQVAGVMTLSGDQIFHPFFWDRRVLTDLGTLGGDLAEVWWLNNAGDVAGGTTTPADESFHATLWRKAVIHDLGTLEGDCFSVALGMNSNDQIVGSSFSCPDASIQRGVLWDKGSIVDLNTLIAGNASLQLADVRYINDRGEIAGRGLPPGCDDLDSCGHDFLLIPCDEAAAQGCNANVGTQSSTFVATNRTAPGKPLNGKEFVSRLRAHSPQRYHIPGLRKKFQ